MMRRASICCSRVGGGLCGPRLLSTSANDDDAQIVARQKAITYVGLASNVSLGGLKCVLGVFGNSPALLSDGLHSLSDGTSDLVALGVVSVARRKPTEAQPYGWGAYESLGSLGVGGLVAAGGVAAGAHSSYSLYQMALHSASVEPVTMVPAALAAAAASVAVKEVLYRATVKVGVDTKSPTLIANAWHHRSDALSSVVTFAGVGGSAVGIPLLDPIAGLGVSVMILKQGYEIVSEGVAALTDRRTEDSSETISNVSKVAQRLIENREISGIHDVRVRRLGSVRLVDLHMVVESTLSVTSAYRASRKLSREIKKADEDVTDVFVYVDGGDLEFVEEEVSVSASHIEIVEAFSDLVEEEFDGSVSVGNTRVHYVNDSKFSFSEERPGGKKLVKAVIESSLLLGPEHTLQDALRMGRHLKRKAFREIPTVMALDLSVQLRL